MGQSMPPVVQGIVGEFAALHPRWDVRICQEVPKDLPNGLKTAIDNCEQWCQVADILYCWLLREHGGVVMDTDILVVRSFEHLLDAGPAWTTRHSDKDKRLTNAVMGAEPDSEAFRTCCDYIEAHGKKRPSQRAKFGPGMLTSLFSGTRAMPGVMKILPWHYFYPLLISERELCAEFLTAGVARRFQILESVRSRFFDGVEPYAVHLWYALDTSFNKIV